MPDKYNLRGFYNNLKTVPLLYKNQFFVTLTGPNVGDDGKDLGFYVQSAKIPGLELTTGTTTFMGNAFKTPGYAKFAHAWTCNVLLTEDLKIYKFFRKWQKTLSSYPKNGGGDKTLKNNEIKIYVINDNGEIDTSSCVVLAGVWCKSVGDISLEYKDGGGDPVKNFPIEFRYQYNFIEK